MLRNVMFHKGVRHSGAHFWGFGQAPPRPLSSFIKTRGHFFFQDFLLYPFCPESLEIIRVSIIPAREAHRFFAFRVPPVTKIIEAPSKNLAFRRAQRVDSGRFGYSS